MSIQPESDFNPGKVLAGHPIGLLHVNLSPAHLVAEALRNGEGRLSDGGAFCARTGKFTGRSPKDKYIVAHDYLRDEIDWGAVNQPMDPAKFAGLKARALEHIEGKELFVQDLFTGADPEHRIKVRVITEQAWHNLFARNMFIRPSADEKAGFEADWTVLQLPSLLADPEVDGTSSTTAICVDFDERLVLVANSAYAGEIKKSIFGVMNFALPARGVMPMHCSANVGDAGDSAVFFGLSGTGKTTLSADPNRTLLGDDEHGWSAQGIFNFEGGCYAKVIKLDPKAEPEIFAASNQFGTVLENVVLDPDSCEPDFDDGTLTENTRSCYPLPMIPNASASGMAGHPKNIVMLTADAFGVLPPISKLTPDQAMYHFLSGYTAKLAGTERGVTEPQATFSACFGAPFMPRHPSVYAELLGQMMERHGSQCWLVNTGWTGGAYGTGQRMPIQATRALLNAALAGRLDGVEFVLDPAFGLMVPTACEGVDAKLLQPRQTWADPAAYDAMAAKLASMFAKNFEKFVGNVPMGIANAGIKVAA